MFLSDSEISKEWVELASIDVLPDEEKESLPVSQRVTNIKGDL